MRTVNKEQAWRKQQVLAFLSYRIPMQIKAIHIYDDGNGYYVCPRCQTTLDREYMAYCDRCGQCLKWKQIRKVTQLFNDHGMA